MIVMSHRARFDGALANQAQKVLGAIFQHRTDRSDPEPSPMPGDELTHQRCCGSLTRTKKLVAALRISMVRSNSAFLRFSSHTSRAAIVVTPSASPASTSAWRSQLNAVSGIPSRADSEG